MKIEETFYTWNSSPERKIRSWKVISYCCKEFEDFLDSYHLFKDLNNDNSISMGNVHVSMENFRYCTFCGEKIVLI